MKGNNSNVQTLDNSVVHKLELEIKQIVSDFISVSQHGHLKVNLLTLHSIITQFDAFEISRIVNHYGKWSICSLGANVPFSIIFSKVFKT